ncbi:hypothetical protein M0804_015346 [Polistes exclamans]|nr:hypothetical protein M0804_015346 [Polistes exclamans]
MAKNTDVPNRLQQFSSTCKDKTKENEFEDDQSTTRFINSCTSSSSIATTTSTTTTTTTTMTTTTMTTTTTISRNYRPRGSLARILYDKQRADERLDAYDKRQVSFDY